MIGTRKPQTRFVRLTYTMTANEYEESPASPIDIVGGFVDRLWEEKVLDAKKDRYGQEETGLAGIYDLKSHHGIRNRWKKS